MTVSSLTNRIDYTADGVLTTYAYNFRIFVASDLLVYAGGALQSSSLYAVSGVGAVGGGNVVFSSAPAAGPLSIQRSVAETQLVDYVAHDAFPAETHEGALDRLTMISQQLTEILGRAIKFSSTSLLKNVDLPDLIASKYLQVDSNGTKIIMGDIVVPGAIALPLSTLNGGTGSVYGTAVTDTTTVNNIPGLTHLSPILGNNVTIFGPGSGNLVAGDVVSIKGRCIVTYSGTPSTASATIGIKFGGTFVGFISVPDASGEYLLTCDMTMLTNSTARGFFAYFTNGTFAAGATANITLAGNTVGTGGVVGGSGFLANQNSYTFDFLTATRSYR